MTAISWNGVNGDWSDAEDWSTGAVPTGADDVAISASGAYTVTISSDDLANSLTFNASDAALLENAGSLTMTGGLTVDSGFVSLNDANTIGGGVGVAGGVLAFGNANALGAGEVTLVGGELLATADEILGGSLQLTAPAAPSTIAAADGTTLDVTAPVTFVSPVGGFAATLNFGSLGQAGVVVWDAGAVNFPPPSPPLFLPTFLAINVVAGTLQAGDDGLSASIVLGGQPTTVVAGATLDAGGFALSLNYLMGAGAVTDSGAATTLTLDGANFSGAIAEPLSLVVAGAVTLSGANTYTGTTTINSGETLRLGAGGATGSIEGGAITDDGALVIDRNNAITLANAISGSGGLRQVGTGVTSINIANSYTGGTTLYAGTLAVGSTGALGTAALNFTDGELLGTANAALGNPINPTFGSPATFAAVDGATLTLSGPVSFTGANSVNIGAPGQDGDVCWSGSADGAGGGDLLNVLDGTLTPGNSDLGLLLGAIGGTTVEAGATLDWAGQAAAIANLEGVGTVTNSGAAQTLTLSGFSNFSGTISGALSVAFNGGDAALSGLEDYTGSATLEGAASVSNFGTYDLVDNANINGTSALSFMNNGLFEKTGAGGVSDVTSDFVNNGTLNVLSGSVTFSGGFTNRGVIDGLVRNESGSITISAPVPADFNGDALSDILWRSANGDTEITDSNGSGGFSAPDNLGVVSTGYQVAGIADFNGDGEADILWRNSSTGGVELWDSNGFGSFTPDNLGVVNTGWQIEGTGDFNGVGQSGILWRNSSTGAVELWNSNGSGGFNYDNLGVVNPSWQIEGTGDFTGNSEDGILWRNSSTGAVELWNSNGSGGFNYASYAPVNSSWQIQGTGDFTGNGEDGILWQNSSTGDVELWNPNGSGGFNHDSLGPANAGLQVEGTGDFTGNGEDSILWQNPSTADIQLWIPNGSGVFTPQDLGVVMPNSFKIQSAWG
jgi:autotransporter-associated beta strand protein